MANAKKRRAYDLKGMGRRARYAREQCGYGLREAADELEIEHSSLSRLEAGERMVELRTLVRLAKLYNIHLDWLIANEGPMTKDPMTPRPSNGGTPVGDRRRRAADEG